MVQNSNISRILFVVVFLGLALDLTGCAYRLGYGQRSLPGGYSQIAIPVFKNKSDIVGIEGSFTNSMIRQFANSKVAKVVDKAEAPLWVEGEIVNVELVHEGRINANEGSENTIGLPSNTVLTTQYRVLTTVALVLKRASDKKIVWQGSVKGERVYPAPQVGPAVINSVNPLYNHNAKVDMIENMSIDMMAEAHDRMTESF